MNGSFNVGLLRDGSFQGRKVNACIDVERELVTVADVGEISPGNDRR